MENVQDRVKAARKSKRLSQTELGEQIGLTYGAISAIEQGRSASVDTIRLIATALDVPYDWLITGEGETPKGVMLKSAPTLETNVWKDALVLKLKEENERLWKALELALGGKPANSQANFRNASAEARVISMKKYMEKAQAGAQPLKKAA